MRFLKEIFVFSLVVLVLTIPSVGYTEQDNIADYRKAVEETNKRRMQLSKQHPEVKPVAPKKVEPTKLKTKKEQICLENGQCVNADFKWGVRAKYLQNACKVYIYRQKSTPSNDESRSIGACHGYLMAFTQTLYMDTVLRYKFKKPIGSFCFNRTRGFPSTASESLAVIFINFMNKYPEMEELNVDYVLFQMLKEHKQLCDQQQKGK